MPLQKKNILFPAVFAGLAWIGVVVIIFVLKPEGVATLAFFFALLFVAVYLSIMLAFSHRRRALLVSSGLLSFLLLRFFNLDTIINSILLIGFLVTFEVYFWKK